MIKHDTGTLRQVSLAEAEAAAAVLARAFYRDPLWLYLFPDPTQRSVMVRQSFRAFAPWFIRNGQMYGVGAPLIAAAVWSIPNAPCAASGRLINVHLATLLASPLILAFRRVIPIFAQFETMHRRYVTGPHFYLSTIGVIPEAQGRSVASLLIKPLLAQADAQSLPAYTETMTPSNVPLYEHYDFQCRERFDLPGTDLKIWLLYRPAQFPR